MAQRVYDTDESAFVLSVQNCRDITASLCGNAPLQRQMRQLPQLLTSPQSI